YTTPIGNNESSYTEGRARITELERAIDDMEAKTPVVTCPEWSVHDVVAHLVGVCADVLAGNVAGAATDSWTAAQVDTRQGRSMAELLDEWDDVGSQIEAMVDNFPGRYGNQVVADVTTHE